jgi:ribose transport system substrate-binding protein
MWTRKRFLLGAVVVASFALVGCGGNAEEKANTPATPSGGTGGAKKTIGVSLSSRNHNFFLGMEQGVKDSLTGKGYDAIYEVAEDNASKQQEQVDMMIRKGVAAIIMVPVDAKQAATAVEAANKANIPVFCIDRRITDPKAKVASTIETDNVAIGEEAGRAALELLGKRFNVDPKKPEEVKKIKTKIVHLWGLEAASSAQDRAKGFEKVVNPTNTPGITVIKQVGNFNAKTAQEVMAPTLTANPDISLVYCHNDDNAMGVLNAITDVKKAREAEDDPKRILIVSIDGNKAAVEQVRKGNLEVTIGQDPIVMGQEAVRMMDKTLNAGKAPKEYLAVPYLKLNRAAANNMASKLWSDKLREKP